jgi:hypothetical protein
MSSKVNNPTIGDTNDREMMKSRKRIQKNDCKNAQ